MSRYFVALTLVLATGLGLQGCGTTGETVGTVGGAVVGGVVGSELTGGSAVGTIGGAAAGGVIGHELGERYEERRH